MVREEKKKKEEEIREASNAAEEVNEEELLEDVPAEAVRDSGEASNEASDQSQSLFEDVEMEE